MTLRLSSLQGRCVLSERTLLGLAEVCCGSHEAVLNGRKRMRCLRNFLVDFHEGSVIWIMDRR